MESDTNAYLDLTEIEDPESIPRGVTDGSVPLHGGNPEDFHFRLDQGHHDRLGIIRAGVTVYHKLPHCQAMIQIKAQYQL